MYGMPTVKGLHTDSKNLRRGKRQVQVGESQRRWGESVWWGLFLTAGDSANAAAAEDW